MAPNIRTRLALTRDRRAFGTFDPRAADDLDRRAHIDSAIAARHCWVAELSGHIAGYGVLAKNFFGRDFIELIYVAEDARRSGVGGALLAAIEQSRHEPQIFTSTNESNAPMRALLAKHGYAPSGRIENLDPADAELVFVKALKSSGATSR
ncbi:MAG TPA: GNAT family N-acetyltransferase [Rhizomicrobium sp.]